MGNKIDLHMHTTASDGKDNPETIVNKAKELGADEPDIVKRATKLAGIYWKEADKMLRTAKY